ncbi:hypothetical protein DDZ13_10045 [Coraliomargarita sinensis]|uniref:Uncharacterized protein n=1 Tax=Coraliomargarita sinensis TaxID=2174842 RepID=A0A317ZJM5_9BACT|nr:hypothetical protein [Coraliomargarita sinensis]PXA03969.1 hypothetical protein DDZ13_10045 [Coraliomargarita sinensis]
MAVASGKVIVSWFLVLVLLLPAQGQSPELRSAGNAQYEIIGLDARSVSYVDELSSHVVKVAERYLDAGALQFPQRILVSLKPEKYAEFEGDYQVRVGERGFVNLDLRWEASLGLRTTCRALTEALLVRYSVLNYGDEGPNFLPEWPVAAIGTKAYLSLRPAQSIKLAAWLAPESTPTVATLLQRKWKDTIEDSNGYALLWAMEQIGLPRPKVRTLMGQSLAGLDISEALLSLIQPADPAAGSLTLDEWWTASWVGLLTPADEPMETMVVSRLWIGALADLSNTEFKELNLSQLWDERENEALRELIEARYEILRLRIVRVNPAYFNAARSLGALFETYLRGTKRHKYVHRLTGFLGDFEDSKVLEEAIGKALGQTSAEGAGQ